MTTILHAIGTGARRGLPRGLRAAGTVCLINPSGEARVHLAIDCYVNGAVQELLRSMAWVA